MSDEAQSGDRAVRWPSIPRWKTSFQARVPAAIPIVLAVGSVVPAPGVAVFAVVISALYLILLVWLADLSMRRGETGDSAVYVFAVGICMYPVLAACAWLTTRNESLAQVAQTMWWNGADAIPGLEITSLLDWKAPVALTRLGGIFGIAARVVALLVLLGVARYIWTSTGKRARSRWERYRRRTSRPEQHVEPKEPI